MGGWRASIFEYLDIQIAAAADGLLLFASPEKPVAVSTKAHQCSSFVNFASKYGGSGCQAKAASHFTGYMADQAGFPTPGGIEILV